MRSEQAFKNMVANLFLQVIVFASGIILPRFFLEAYGSNINGMITSINQFLAYLGLAEAGVGTASVVALYAPLANNNTKEVNGVLSAARRFYNRSGMLFLGLVGVLTVVYPFMISGQLDNTLVRSMILVLASSTLVDYFFLGKYRVLLTAPRGLYSGSDSVSRNACEYGFIHCTDLSGGKCIMGKGSCHRGVYAATFLGKALCKETLSRT